MNLVSVIIPTFNNQTTLPKAIESVFEQSYSNLEIIVVDDGSTDQTCEVLRPYQNHIRYKYQSNQERSNARNHGIQLAKGNLIAFLDADDWWLPDKIRRQVDIFETSPDIGMVYSQAYVVDNEGKICSITGSAGTSHRGVGFYCDLLSGNYIPSPTPIIRKKLLTDVRGFDESLHQGEDWDCWLRIVQLTTIKFIAEPLACYRVMSGGNLFEQMYNRGGSDSHVEIILKAIQRGGCSQENFDKALGFAYFQSAMVEAGCDLLLPARRRLETVKQKFPGFYDQYQEHLLEQAANLAVQASLGEYETSKGEAFLEKFWTALPEGTYPIKVKKSLLAKFHTMRFFQASQANDKRLMLQSFFSILRIDYSSLGNRGLWSDFFRKLKS